ncbi:Uncharacterized protein M6B38_110060 [Iris pallida]|uniref:Uncharacterized protein n=1 Tax=Iris pallida TaxID=29817 RepID=A0AAX6DZI0_IRIPA|nr:Uncharacterized protein M6B38_110060 [Iris pallida]
MLSEVDTADPVVGMMVPPRRWSPDARRWHHRGRRLPKVRARADVVVRSRSLLRRSELAERASNGGHPSDTGMAARRHGRGAAGARRTVDEVDFREGDEKGFGGPLRFSGKEAVSAVPQCWRGGRGFHRERHRGVLHARAALRLGRDGTALDETGSHRRWGRCTGGGRDQWRDR